MFCLYKFVYILPRNSTFVWEKTTNKMKLQKRLCLFELRTQPNVKETLLNQEQVKIN